MGDHQPEVWVSDLFSAQKTHPAKAWQVCLAHQLRDCQYGIDARSIVNTGMRHGLSAFQAIEATLDPTQSLFPLGGFIWN